MSSEEGSRLFREASVLAEAGVFPRAAELFVRAAAASEGDEAARPLEAGAQCLLELDRPDEALDMARQAAVAKPRWAAGAATFGRALLNAGHLQDAVEQLSIAHDLAKETASAENAQEADQELARDLAQDCREAMELLERHWTEHHDIVLASGPGPLRIRQSFDCKYCNLCGEHGPGGAVWAAGVALAQLVLSSSSPPGFPGLTGADHQAAVDVVPSCCWDNLRVLELGSGTGVAGLAAAMRGSQVLLTDRPPLLQLLAKNLELNLGLLSQQGGSASLSVFDWSESLPAEIRAEWDLVLAADAVYSFAAIEQFAGALDAVLISPPCEPKINGSSGKPAVVGAPLALYAHNPRSADLDNEMLRALRNKGLHVSPVPGPKLSAVANIPLAALERVVFFGISRRSTGNQGTENPDA